MGVLDNSEGNSDDSEGWDLDPVGKLLEKLSREIPH